MSQTLQIAPKGLFTNYNQIDNIPNGSLLTAKNIVIRRMGIAEKRPGFTVAFPSATLLLDSIFSYRNYLHVISDRKLYLNTNQTEIILPSNPVTVGVYLGDLNPPSQLTPKVRSCEASDSMYFTTADGIKKISEPANLGLIAPSGIQKAICAKSSSVPTNKAFTSINVDVATDSIEIEEHGFKTGLKIRFTTTGSLPTGLNTSDDFYVIYVDEDHFQLATSIENALAGTEIDFTTTGAGASAIVLQDNGFLPQNNTVAYRVVFGFKDQNGYTLLSSPSDRLLVTNTDASENLVYLEWLLPSTINEFNFYQVYRSLPASAGITPNDELYLVKQNELEPSDISNGYFSFTDSFPDSALGATLYTSPSIEGLANSNEQPPMCAEMTLFRGSLFFANTISKQRSIVNLVSVTDPGLQVNDIVYIDGNDYTASSTEVANSRLFKLYTDGTESENIANTAKSLIRVLNSDTAARVYAYSGGDESGSILFEERLIGGLSFSISCSKEKAFSPSIVTPLESDNDASVSRIYYSKLNQVESVPLFNFFNVGDLKQPIRRILSLQDLIFVFKDDGIFSIDGNAESGFIVRPFDNSTFIYGDDTAVVINQSIFVHTNKGVYQINSANMKLISDPIDNELKQFIRYQTPTGKAPQITSDFQRYAFGVSYQQNNEYILWFNSSDRNQSNFAYVYNFYTGAWYSWDQPCYAACVHNNKLWLSCYGPDGATGLYSTIYQENTTEYIGDYADYGIPLAFTRNSALSIDITPNTSVLAGMWITYNGKKSKILTSNGTTLTLETDVTLPASGTVLIYKEIETDCIFVLNDGGNPGLLKQFVDTTVLFEDSLFSDCDIQFINNYDKIWEGGNPVYTSTTAWGDGAWGDGPWGGYGLSNRAIRMYVPRNKSRGRYLFLRVKHSKLFEKISILGISYNQNMNQDRISENNG
jgi:hypothetical protein